MKDVKIEGLDCIEVPGDPELGTIVLLHGYGANNMDLASLSRVYTGPRWIFPNGPIELPIAPDYVGRAWFHLDLEKIQQAFEKKEYEKISAAFSPELEEAQSVVRKFIAGLNIPHRQLTLGGFSQGAVLAIESALNFTDQIKSLLIFSGTLVHEASWRNLSHKHKGLPFFMSHGKNDRLLPFQMAENLERLLKEGGLEGRLHPFTGGHEIPFSLLLDLQPFLAKTIGR